MHYSFASLIGTDKFGSLAYRDVHYFQGVGIHFSSTTSVFYPPHTQQQEEVEL